MISLPAWLTTDLKFWILILPSLGDSKLDFSAEELATPPTWKVLIVSWVPGSPIDCAAIIPTASPVFTGSPLARSLPYALAQIPFTQPQVIGDLILTDVIFSFSMVSISSCEIYSPFFIITFPSDVFTSSARYRPKTLSFSGIATSPDSYTVSTVSPLEQEQSFWVMVKSWATSTSLLVKYPELAVLSAVSARPFLAPWVELKYSRTVRPSLKLEVIGFSIISPEGLAIKPLIPANCLSWASEPLAPEWAIIYTELIWLSFVVETVFIIAFATLSVHVDQSPTTLLYFSLSVIKPSWYCASKLFTCFWVSWIKEFFSSGITRSSFPKEIPALAAYLKPTFIIWSTKIHVAFWPVNL